MLASLLAAVLAALTLSVYPLGADGATAAAMAAVLVVLAAIDLERRVIPNRIVLPAILLLLAARIGTFPGRAPEFALAALAAGAAFLAPNLISQRLMGMGDVKLATMLGAGLGWGVIGAVCAAFLAVFPFGLGALARGGVRARTATLPFAPFLALGGCAVLLVPRLLGVGVA
jgi:leader peptidase (prepilin peptidase)/N-methyltransferase